MDEISSGNKIPKICGLCEKSPSKYCCPRCEVFYCSLDCYKCEKHAECSENFYRDCIEEDLAGNLVDKESQQKIIEMLKRERNEMSEWENEDIMSLKDDEIDSDDENVADLHERVKNLDLDDADAIWEVLTQDEKNEFEAMLKNSNVDSLIPNWVPWWFYKNEDKLIVDANAVDDEESMHLSKCPALVNVPDYFTHSKPNPQVRFNITSCIGAYALVMRYFNGELNSKLYLEAAAYMYLLCDNLKEQKNFTNDKDALESIAQKSIENNLLITTAENIHQMKEDVSNILKGPSKKKQSSYCKSALSQMHAIFTEARKSLKSVTKPIKKKSNFSGRWPDPSMVHLQNEFEMDSVKLKLSIKKIEYYLSYLNSIYSHYVICDNKQPFVGTVPLSLGKDWRA